MTSGTATPEVARVAWVIDVLTDQYAEAVESGHARSRQTPVPGPLIAFWRMHLERTIAGRARKPRMRHARRFLQLNYSGTVERRCHSCAHGGIRHRAGRGADVVEQMCRIARAGDHAG